MAQGYIISLSRVLLETMREHHFGHASEWSDHEIIRYTSDRHWDHWDRNIKKTLWGIKSVTPKWTWETHIYRWPFWWKKTKSFGQVWPTSIRLSTWSDGPFWTVVQVCKPWPSIPPALLHSWLDHGPVLCSDQVRRRVATLEQSSGHETRAPQCSSCTHGQ